MISLVEGFYPFGKRSKTQATHQEMQFNSEDIYVKSSGSSVDESGDTMPTGVSRYLSALPVETGVSKYLKKNNAASVTGVSKYLLKRSIDRKELNQGLTGVTRYLGKHNRNALGPSSVAKYMAHQIIDEKQKPKQTGVGHYIARMEILESKNQALTGVAKYQAEHDLIQRKIAAQNLIAKYKEEEAKLAQAKSLQVVDVVEEAVFPNEEPAATRVGRYLQQKVKKESSKPSASSVAKYIANQIIWESKKPKPSGVARYLIKTRVYKPKPVISTVSKYLIAQSDAAKDKPRVSGVAKYLIRQSILSKTAPQVSTVAKYVLKQGMLDKSKESIDPAKRMVPASSLKKEPLVTGVSHYLSRQAALMADAIETAIEEAVPCLEGEFIPADTSKDSNLETGVSKYINKKPASKKKKSASRKLTGVEKYLAQSA